MLFLHIGSPKTGSTAIQWFLRSYSSELANHGYLYPDLGVGYSHNRLAQEALRGGERNTLETLFSVVRENPDKKIIASSEMIFRRNTIKRFFDLLPEDIKDQMHVICYLRRQDIYFESLFKQKLKTGNTPDDPVLFRHRKAGSADYFATLKIVASAVGSENISPRIFQRGSLYKGDVAADFLQVLDAEQTWNFTFQRLHANPSFSRIFTALINDLGRELSLHPRQIARAANSLDLEGIFRSNDVYTLPQRIEIMQEYSDSNEMLRKEYFSDEDVLFDVSDLKQNTGNSEEDWLKGRLEDSHAAARAVAPLLRRLGLLSNS